MKKISNYEITDLVRYADDAIIIVEKVPTLDVTKPNANYYLLNLKTFEKEAITKSVYLMKKFGTAYQKIADKIASVAQCDAVVFPSREVFVLFPNGQCGLFDAQGELQWTKTLSYNDREVSSLAAEDGYIWCCCRDENCVIRYSTDNFKVDLRIGGKDADTFPSPEFLSTDGSNIYVCCNGRRLRKISLQDFTVSDVTDGIPLLRRFYRFGATSLLCMADGAYIGEDD